VQLHKAFFHETKKNLLQRSNAALEWMMVSSAGNEDRVKRVRDRPLVQTLYPWFRMDYCAKQYRSGL
jgi:hypothetical protein|tara:strand:- start:48 stop:248 length:201 start_codon:yes stop_codon:yes gene_type:complete